MTTTIVHDYDFTSNRYITWLGVRPRNANREKVRALYCRRYGYPPLSMRTVGNRASGLLLVGPISIRKGD